MATDDPTRARLVALIGACRHNAKAEEIADALLAAKVTLPEPPAPVWPVTVDALKAWEASDKDVCFLHTDYYRDGCVWCRREVTSALAAAAPHLWRAKVESLTLDEIDGIGRAYRRCDSIRAALLALAGGER